MSDASDDEEAPPLAVPLEEELEAHKETVNTTEGAHGGSDAAGSTAEPPPLPPTVPVMLLTGFLGAGKTTLVNYILTAKHGYRCAVLLNEIGDSADIERALVREPEVRRRVDRAGCLRAQPLLP
jgi:hypothetical protein